MNQRYYVSYKHWDGESRQTTTTILGQFWDQEEAERFSSLKYGASEYEIISIRTETSYEAARYKTYRFLIRLTRIICAIVVGFFSYAWLYEKSVDTGDIPLASLTGNMIFTNLMYTGLAIAAVWLCLALAFGDGPE